MIQMRLLNLKSAFPYAINPEKDYVEMHVYKNSFSSASHSNAFFKCKKDSFITVLFVAFLIIIGGYHAEALSNSNMADGIIYVDQSNTGGIESGDSWSTAFTSLQDAIDYHNSMSGPIDEIWVAQGNYRPDVGQNYTLNNRSASFVLPSGVQFLGGFPSGGGTLMERDWVANPTRLNGEIGNPGIGDNSANIIVTQNVSNTTLLDGFIIENGNATILTSTGQRGGAWLNAVDGVGNSSSPQIRNCVFQNNSSITSGGAIFNNATNGGNAEMSFRGCRFINNQTTSTSNGFGGAIYNGNTTNGIANMELVDCYFEGNTGNIGGAIRSIGRDGGTGAISLTVINCLFYQNTAWSMSGISCFNLNGTSNVNKIINSTFYGNTSTGGGSGGGGIRMDNVTSGSQVINCILWANVASESPGTNQLRLQGGSVTVRNNTIQDYASTVNGNSNSNPLFVDEMNGDFRLTEASPAIDSGDNDAYQSASGNAPADDTDLDGNDRLVESTIDRGPYEYAIPCPEANIVYVDASATGFNNGTSWVDAYTDLQSAFDNECPGISEVWVAAGTYYPTQNRMNTSAGPLDRSNTFSLRNGLALYGGFNGTENNREERDWNTNLTILSGDIDQNDGPGEFENNDLNAFAVVTGISIDASAVIDGFVITGGKAEENSLSFIPDNTDRTGAGMYNYLASPTISNCTFSGNKASFGGGMFNNESSPTMTNCVFSGNEAFIGGGLSLTSSSSSEITNCVFIGNYARNNGGGVSISSESNPIFTNCTFSGNSADDQGGAITANNFASTIITNSIIWNNSAGVPAETSASVFTQINASTTISNSLIAKSGGSENWGMNATTLDGGNNIDADPLFVAEPAIMLGAEGDLRLQACSPAINVGDNASLPVGILEDLEGNSRIFNSVVDMGAYEYQDLPTPVIADCRDQTIYLDNLGGTTLSASELDNGSTGCGMLVFAVDNAAVLSFSCADIGPNTAILTVTDERGESATCSATVMVQDTVSPIFMCPADMDVNLDDMCQLTIPDLIAGLTGTDNCGTVSFSQNPTAGSMTSSSHNGSVFVTITANDGNGNSSECTVTLTGKDVIEPDFICPTDMDVNLDATCQLIIPDLITDLTGTDNCGTVSFLQNPAAGTAIASSHNGIVTVMVTANDGNGNSSECTVTLTGMDVIQPNFICPADQNVPLNATCQLIIPDLITGLTGTDNCGTLSFSQNPTAGTILGSSHDDIVMVAITGNDGNGNSTECIVILTGKDFTAPTIDCPEDITVNADSGLCSAMVMYSAPEGVDNCSGTITMLSDGPESGTEFPDGITTITYEVQDLAGNTASCYFTITVADSEPPSVQCFNSTINFEGEQSISLDPNDLVEATDNCGIQSISLSPSVINSEQIGQTISVNVTVSDFMGNTASCVSEIIVTGLPEGWSQNSDGVGCTDGNDITYDFSTQIWTATSTNCFYGPPFNSDAMAFAQRTLCGNGSITAQVTGISGTSLGWAGVVMRESNSPGAKKAQLMTNLSNISRREFRTVTNGAAHPQQFPTFNRYWLRIVRSGNQFVMYVSPNGLTWSFAGAQNISMQSCIEVGLVTTNYSSNSTVTATFTNVSFVGSDSPNGVESPVETTNRSLPITLSGVAENFKVYPNPTSGDLYLKLRGYEGRNVRIGLYGIEGRLLEYLEIEELQEVEVRMDMTAYPSGMYMLQVKSEGIPDRSKRIVISD